MSDFFTKQYLVLDSAVESRLQALGMSPDACIPDWIRRHPDPFRTLKSFDLAAGCDLLTAPTGGATAEDLRNRGVKADVSKLNRSLVTLTRELAAGRPVGACLYPIDSEEPLPFDTTVSLYTEQAAALEKAGVDFFSIEKQRSMAECRAAVIAVRSVSEKPVLCCFTPAPSARSQQGEDLVAVMICLQDMGIEAFGISDCGNMGLMTRLLTKLKRYAAVPLLARPAAGASAVRDSLPRYSFSTAKIVPYLPRFLTLGARLLSGSYGTDSDLIAAARTAVDSFAQEAFLPAEPRSLAASPYRVVELTPRIKIIELEIDDDIIENASIAEETGAKLLKVEIRDDMDLDTLAEAQFSVRLPLAVRCDDQDLMLRFLHIYNGKPVIL